MVLMQRLYGMGSCSPAVFHALSATRLFLQYAQCELSAAADPAAGFAAAKAVYDRAVEAVAYSVVRAPVWHAVFLNGSACFPQPCSPWLDVVQLQENWQNYGSFMTQKSSDVEATRR